MDVSTAKTLVSAVTVCAIAVFSACAMRMFLTEIARDFRSARTRRPAGTDKPAA